MSLEICLSDDSITHRFASHMTSSTHHSYIHYVSATSSFPLHQFMHLIPVDKNKDIYDNIEILTALDMNELQSVIWTLYQQLIRYISSDDEPISHWICIDGLHTMFRYTHLQDIEYSHTVLNTVLLRLRQLVYKHKNLKVSLLFPKHEIPEYLNYSTDASIDNVSTRPKRFKRTNTGTMIGDYIWKYYT